MLDPVFDSHARDQTSWVEPRRNAAKTACLYLCKYATKSNPLSTPSIQSTTVATTSLEN